MIGMRKIGDRGVQNWRLRCGVVDNLTAVSEESLARTLHPLSHPSSHVMETQEEFLERLP
jgi:hypothetical protein